MDFLNINETVKNAIRIAKIIAREYGNEYFSSAHLLKALLHKESGIDSFIRALGKEVAYIDEWATIRIEELPVVGAVGEIVGDDSIPLVFETADNVRIKLGLFEINPICVLAALAKPGVGFKADQLKSFPIKENEILDFYFTGEELKDSISHLQMGEEAESKGLATVFKFCVDKNNEALNLKIDDIVSREKEMRMMFEILGRRSKPNVMIIGDSGVGKTALVDGLAKRIVDNNVPSFLADATVFELDLGSLIAGATYKGEIEDRMKNIIKELRTIDKAILFIDEIHMLMDPKHGNTGAANILKPEMSKGDLTIIGATTIDEYRKFIETDHAFNRRFETLQMNEPDIDSAVKMVSSVLNKYSNYHELKVDPDAILECIKLAKRYTKERRLPDSAIDLLDRTLSATKMINQTAAKDILDFTKQLHEIEESELLSDEKLKELRFILFTMKNKLSPVLLGLLTEEVNSDEIDDYEELLAYIHRSLDILRDFTKDKIEKIGTHEIAAIISNKTGIPIGKIQSEEKEKLLSMESILNRRVIGQDRALKTVTDAILESRSGLNKADQPIGSFFFLGPTGTGKTELAKAIAEALFNDEKAIIRFDMSEFKEEHSAALLYGAPPGYVGYEEGGLLVNKIRQQPYAIVLFDEIEKAHQSVYDIFLQIMDEGKLHDRLGKEGDFSNALIIFTSNVGSEWISEQLSAGKVPTTTQMMEVMGNTFRPEFLARLSEIVPFSPINEDMLVNIFNIQLKGLNAQLEKQGIELIIDDETKKILANRGFTPKYGARQIAGVIRNYLRRPISRFIVSGQVGKGSKLKVSLNEEQDLVWNTN